MRLLAARITNFRSFKKTQEFKFPESPGLYFMQGLNESEPRLGANGAGKSTIWDAITWCCFEKTSRGLKAGDVNNWEAGKGTRVETDWITPSGEEVTMARTWGPNSWKLWSTGAPDRDVEDLAKAKDNYFLGWLGLEFDPFRSCILTAQGQPMFLDQDHNAQAALFSKVMGLDRWIDYSGKASKAASAQDAKLRTLERREAQLKGEIESMGRTDLRQSLEDWDAERTRRLDKIEAAWAGYEQHSFAAEDLKACEDKEAIKRQALKNCIVGSAHYDRLKDMKAELAKQQTRAAVEESKLEQLDEVLRLAETNGACPTCGAVVKVADHQAHLKKVRSEYERQEAIVERVLQDAALAERNLAGFDQRVREWGDAEDFARKELTKAVDETANARRLKSQEDKEIDRLEDEHERIVKEVNPFEAMTKKNRNELQRLREELADVEEELDNRRHRHSIYSMWVRGFKEVRLQQIAEALTELEIEVNSCVAALGLMDWELKFQVDRETKGGSIQRGFSVLVRSPHNELAVPWAAWSGGEAQRLRIAANMGLADLIRSRTGASLNLETWDEPTQGLSPEGVSDLLEALAGRAQAEQRQIWIVDHRTHNFGGFAGGATIVKAPSGSRIRYDY